MKKALRLIIKLLVKFYWFWENESRAEEVPQVCYQRNNDGARHIGLVLVALVIVSMILAIGIRVIDNWPY